MAYITAFTDGKFATGTYNVGYFDRKGYQDETQFFAVTPSDLKELWDEFATENGYSLCSVNYVELVDTDVEILEEYLDRVNASVSFVAGQWFLRDMEYGGQRFFGDWCDMIAYMVEQNELMRG